MTRLDHMPKFLTIEQIVKHYIANCESIELWKLGAALQGKQAIGMRLVREEGPHRKKYEKMTSWILVSGPKMKKAF